MEQYSKKYRNYMIGTRYRSTSNHKLFLKLANCKITIV